MKKTKDPAAVSLGRKGGNARAKSLNPQSRLEIATKASQAAAVARIAKAAAKKGQAQMNATNAGERMFSVILSRRPARYPLMNGKEAIACMERLEVRGYTCIAETEANGVRETLTLSEMKEAII